MVEMDRRSLITTAGLASAALSTGALSACSPVDTSVNELPAKFFAKISVGRVAEARAELEPTATLSLVTTEGAQLFEGAGKVAAAVDRLLNVDDYSMIGDTRDIAMGGLYWTAMGPWACSDMVKGKAPQLQLSGCVDQFADPVLNVLVGLAGSMKIANILILENRRLSGQMADDVGPPPPIAK